MGSRTAYAKTIRESAHQPRVLSRSRGKTEDSGGPKPIGKIGLARRAFSDC
jgi:hypothetical protein